MSSGVRFYIPSLVVSIGMHCCPAVDYAYVLFLSLSLLVSGRASAASRA